MTSQQNPEDLETPNDLFSISISLDANHSADDDDDEAAESAAGDRSSTVNRTFQSEEEFQKQKASYSAKIYSGKGLLGELVERVPQLGKGNGEENSEKGKEKGKIRLGKKEVQFLGYVVGEMYYDREYEGILELCGRVREKVMGVGEGEGGREREREMKKLEESLGRWEGRCREKIEKREGRGKEKEGLVTT
ncbi:hypothetical protein CERZMDRAFT_100817 [Cercospora zeae-maydis SCOH1-5]|uniref:Uncharacterized protein n=1 Tax=Cercospora zeae-maydis SCOH1-5 TaxID=717836 RepID=A0A6A6F8E9_9PEZI|nr:hypothetical protein CERZMDRAFT_100817 [Cercospora zeae-maydis SCOH1-5]